LGEVIVGFGWMQKEDAERPVAMLFRRKNQRGKLKCGMLFAPFWSKNIERERHGRCCRGRKS